MGFTVNEDGRIVQLVEQEVDADEGTLERQLQEERDNVAQELETHRANLEGAEARSTEAEAVADQAQQEVERHKTAKEEAEARLQKSDASITSFQEAKRLRDERAGAEPENGADSDPDNSEPVDVPVHVVDNEPVAAG